MLRSAVGWGVGCMQLDPNLFAREAASSTCRHLDGHVASASRDGRGAFDGPIRCSGNALRTLGRASLVLSAAILMVSGCISPDDAGGTHAAVGSPVPFRLVQEFGGHEDELYFSTIVDGFLLADSAIVIADAQERTVTKIQLGEHRFVKLGGPGQGPGEFRNITAIGKVGEADLWVTDRRTGRVTIFDRGAEPPVTTATVHDYFFAPPIAPEGPLALLSDGTALVTPSRPEVRPLFPDTLVQYHLVRVDLSGSVVDTILSPPPAAFDGLLLERPDGGYTLTRRFLNETPKIAVSSTGSEIGFLHRTAGLNDSMIGTLYVVRLNRGMVDVDTLRIPGKPIPGGRAEFLRRAEGLGVTGWGAGPRAFAETVVDRLGIPERISPIFTYRLDSEGGHWIAVEEEFQGEVRWLRRPPGQTEWRGVEFDRPVRLVLDAWGDLLIGVLVDSLDTQTVGVFVRDDGS